MNLDNYELNHIAVAVVEAYAETLGEAMAHEKADRLNNEDQFKTVLWLNNLDSTRMSIVAKKLNVDADELASVANWLTKIY